MEVITTGRSNMPALAGLLTAEQIRDVAAFVAQEFGKAQ
jgi:mono/diheme cytochrome c family protein